MANGMEAFAIVVVVKHWCTLTQTFRVFENELHIMANKTIDHTNPDHGCSHKAAAAATTTTATSGRRKRNNAVSTIRSVVCKPYIVQ
jgi:hypothetical protein